MGSFAVKVALLASTAIFGCTVQVKQGQDQNVGGTSGTGTGGAGGDAGTLDCGAVTDQGQCNKDVLTYCENSILKTLDCASVGASCQVTGNTAACQPVSRALSCGQLTKLGTCDGAVIRYCDETGLVGVPRSIDCAAYGQICNPTAASDGGALCVPQGACPADVTAGGVCSGNHLRFCDGANLYDFDCGLDQCKTVSAFSDCFMTAVVTGCGTETAVGRCDGQTRISCPGSTIVQEDCSAIGLTCGTTATGARCQRGTTCPAACPTGYSCNAGLCAPTTTPTREWTVAVYLVGNNNLSDEAWLNLNQMESVGSSNALAIVTEAEFSPEYSNSVPSQYQTGTYRFLVNQDSDTQTVTSLASAQSIGATNMSSGAAFTSFIQWAAQSYPAKHFALIVWDHGMGYEGGFVDDSAGGSDLLTLKEIASGIANSGVHPDLVAFDACLMGMHEVALALRGVTDWLVASEEIEPGSGYPYDKILTHLQQTPALTPKQLGTAIVDEYGASYNNDPRGQTATQSLADLSKVESFNDSLLGFADSLSGNLAQNRPTVLGALDSSDVLRFRLQNNADIHTAMAAMQSVTGAIATSATATGSAYDGSGIVADTAATGRDTAATGLSMFFPTATFDSSDLEQYRQNTSFLPLQPWYTALANLRDSSSTATVPGTGAVNAFSVILSWASTPDGKQSGVDLDLYVYEPNGDFAVPVNGTVSENGLLSGDSYDTGVPRESYELKADHMSGTYIVLVSFYDGPAGESAYPRLQLFRSDVPGGSRTYVRGKITNRTVTEIPMDSTKPLTTMIDQSNFAGVQNLDYSNIWYAFTVEVQ